MAHAVKLKRPPNRSRPRWQRRKEARPAEIVSAALQVFVERGYAATRLQDVARRAGVTKGTVYLYFESKEALFKAVVRETIVPSIARFEEIAKAHTGTSRELFLELIRNWWQQIGESPVSGIPKLMLAEAVNFPELARFYYDEVVSRAHRLVASVLERGMASGEFRRVDIPAAVRLVVAPLLHAAHWRHSFALCMREPFDVPTYVESHADIFLNGIAHA